MQATTALLAHAVIHAHLCIHLIEWDYFLDNSLTAFTTSSPLSLHFFLFLIPRSVVQEQDAANALISLKSCTSATSSPLSTPTPIFTYTMSNTMVTSVIHTPEPNTELVQALRESDASSSAPGDTNNGYEPQTNTCTTDQQCDVKHSPLSIQQGFTLTTSDGVTPASISPTMSSMVENSPLTKPKRPSRSGNYVCKLCGKSYSRPYTLKSHMRVHSGDTPYRCDTCDKAFIQASNLTVHLRTHSGEKPYSCDLCGRAFTQSSNLTVHLYTHSGEKPFSCPICHMCFSQSYSVTIHLRTHSGERPYRCDYCDKAFLDSSTLTKHKRIHSGEKPYRCKICSLEFTQSGTLQRHIKTHIKTHTNTTQ